LSDPERPVTPVTTALWAADRVRRERSNLSMRTFMRRFTRLALGFSKKFENHCHMVALYTVWYNFVKIHKTLKMTPAMAAGVTGKLWSVGDIVDLVEVAEAPAPEMGDMLIG
jgi:hypothetical protein